MLIRVLADLAECTHILARRRLVFAYGALVTCREARAARHLARGAFRAVLAADKRQPPLRSGAALRSSVKNSFDT